MTTIDIAAATSSLRRTVRVIERAALVPGEGARRALNVAVAAIGLLVSAPLMALIAGAIRLTSAGPVIYRQTRVGIDRRRAHGGHFRRVRDIGGRPFTIYKFRTMETASGRHSAERWASPDDPRVTSLGRILRKYRLDELPQLWNVLLGDMNVVGPRPEQPAIFASLREQIPGYASRQTVRPGITGRAQVNQHYDTCLDDVKRKVAFDLEYVSRQSFQEDLAIMVKTIPTMAFKRGAW
jgi:lipopolysaccharide/colanic/teichoic acid biosynthesis glycosyltransferase